jgi:tetratricopeptide (TPR) repeat protein
MPEENPPYARGKICLAVALLLCLVFAAYANTWTSSWHFDDHPNIVQNAKLHITELTFRSLLQTFFARPDASESLHRPVANLTFAMNWYLFQDRVTGYHLTNMTIHFLTALSLLFVILDLYRSPQLKHIPPANAYLIAILAAVLWAVNPIQTQAVTYIVQRMASLAAMFFILGLYFYVKGRNSGHSLRQICLYTGCFISYILATGSKENAVLMPLSLVLIETVFFQDLSLPQTRKRIYQTATAVCLAVLLIGSLLFMQGEPFSIFKSYAGRSFSLLERVLTEPRVLVFYLSQIFYPMPHRLSIEHDFSVSTSLLEPWTTLPAICLIGLLIGLGIFQIQKRPIFAFGILFYFLNHLIESSILPLELVFEHRNYLPSLFLFWPLTAAMIRLLDSYRFKKSFMFASLAAFMALLILGLGFGTYIRNMDWATEKTLWEDAIKKAPGRARPAYSLAKYYYKAGNSEIAMALFNKSLFSRASKPKYSRALALNGMAGIYYRQKNYEKVIELSRRALASYPGFEAASFNAALACIKAGRWKEASKFIDLLLEKRKDYADYRFLKGFWLLKQNKPETALTYLGEALRIKPGERKFLLVTGICLSSIRLYKQAEWFFKQALDPSARDIQPYFYLLENSAKAGDLIKADQYLDRMITLFSVPSISAKLTGNFDDVFLIPPSRELIAPMINAKLIKIAHEISGHGPG